MQTHDASAASPNFGVDHLVQQACLLWVAPRRLANQRAIQCRTDHADRKTTVAMMATKDVPTMQDRRTEDLVNLVNFVKALDARRGTWSRSLAKVVLQESRCEDVIASGGSCKN